MSGAQFYVVMSEPGLVVARFRRHALVENRNGETVDCRLQGRRLRPVVGDKVEWRREPDGSATLEKVGPRSSALRRLDSRGRPEVVAANLSQLIVVLAPRPRPDWFLLDRYLCAAELSELRIVIAFNKIDLVEEPPRRLEVYREVGYAVAQFSALEGTGLHWLERALGGERSVLIGQSGVGKSSLFNALLGDNLQKVGDLSGKLHLGRHTTTTAVLHRHPGGGEIIDSPGVRNYIPHVESPGEVQRGFREIAIRRDGCRFDDCTHRAEPGCAVKSALAQGKIDRERYDNYTKIHALAESARTH